MHSNQADAKMAEHLYYFTGKPCKWGHIVPRISINGRCTECNRLSTNKYYAKHRARPRKLLTKEEKLKKKRACYEANRERERARDRELYKRNREASIARIRAYYLENREAILEKRKEYRRKNKGKISNTRFESLMKNKYLVVKFKGKKMSVSDHQTGGSIETMQTPTLKGIRYDTKLGKNMIVFDSGTTNRFNTRIHGGEILLRSWLGFSKYIHVNCTGYIMEGRYPED